MNIYFFFRWHEVSAVLWINAVNWIMIMAKRLMIFNRFSYSCHIINSIYKVKVIVNLHGSLSEVLGSQCLVDLTQPNLFISTVMKFLSWILNFPMLIILRFLKNWTFIVPISSGEKPQMIKYIKIYLQRKSKVMLCLVCS